MLYYRADTSIIQKFIILANWDRQTAKNLLYYICHVIPVKTGILSKQYKILNQVENGKQY